jgi:serine/threonine-protein kinase
MDAGPPAAEAHSPATMILAEPSGSSARRRTSWWTLPPDVLDESVRRIRVLAWLYALAFFLAGVLPALIIPESRKVMFSEASRYLPAVVSIAGGLAVALLVSHPRLPARYKLLLGLAFEVLASAGIAAAEYSEVASPILFTKDRLPGGFGLSWVAPWVMLFSVVVPTRPVAATLAAALSIAMVPLFYAAGVAGGSNLPLVPLFFFFSLIFPYLVVLLMAHVGARVVYRLGTAVREARELGSYRLRERLGAGGMGEVWRAEHRLLARPAAIKLIRGAAGRTNGAEVLDEARRRFEREAQAIASLRSPHTVELFDFGVAQDGTFYYAMELLEGLDADTLVRRFGPVEPERAIYLLRQVCRSLAEAEAFGLVHRDIKPANIFLCRYGIEHDFVKVLDFGLVKSLDGRAARPEPGPALTADAVIQGTPAFMAPEQALGGPTLDIRADIYATGCVAYWLLTSQYVFTADTPMGVLMHHAHTPPIPPSSRTARPIPDALDRLVMQCLAKDPAERPQSATELLHRLDRIALPNPWSEDRAREWWQRQGLPGPS